MVVNIPQDFRFTLKLNQVPHFFIPPEARNAAASPRKQETRNAAASPRRQEMPRLRRGARTFGCKAVPSCCLPVQGPRGFSTRDPGFWYQGGLSGPRHLPSHVSCFNAVKRGSLRTPPSPISYLSQRSCACFPPRSGACFSPRSGSRPAALVYRNVQNQRIHRVHHACVYSMSDKGICLPHLAPSGR